MYELSKGEIKVARAAIDKGLDAEFREGMEQFEAIIKDWREGKFETTKDAYHTLFKAIDQKDNAIARRYNGLSSSNYLLTVLAVLQDGYITEEDIEGFRDETKTVLEYLLKE